MSVAWVAFKVGALSFGGGFVIIPLMQSDAVGHYHWMTGTSSSTPSRSARSRPDRSSRPLPWSATPPRDSSAGLLASLVAFAPSFAFVLLGARRFDRHPRRPPGAAFLDGAGPAAIGAIFGSAIPLARALSQPWQYAVLGAAILCSLLRRGVVLTLLRAGADRNDHRRWRRGAAPLTRPATREPDPALTALIILWPAGSAFKSPPA